MTEEIDTNKRHVVLLTFVTPAGRGEWYCDTSPVLINHPHTVYTSIRSDDPLEANQIVVVEYDADNTDRVDWPNWKVV